MWVHKIKIKTTMLYNKTEGIIVDNSKTTYLFPTTKNV